MSNTPTDAPQPGRMFPGSQAADPQGFVTHAELLRIAIENHCAGIHTQPIESLCRPEKNFWVFRAIVYKSPRCRGFVGYGDAHPGNVSPLIFLHAEMRMAETRAVNRALRKAYGIGLCSLEELPPSRMTPEQTTATGKILGSPGRFSKGISHAHQNPRTQSKPRRQRVAGRRVPRPGGELRPRRPRR